MKKRLCILLTLLIGFLLTLSLSACNSKINSEPTNINTPANTEVTNPNTTTVKEDKNEAKNFEILPTMDTVSNAKNQVWVGTFQLVWNDLMDELIKQPVEFIGIKSDIADKLNKKSFTTKDISDSAYYKKWGLASYEMKKEIEQGIKEKFNEKSDILDNFDFTPEPDKYFLYAMLKKDFQYLYSFKKLENDKFNGSKGNVKYFGIKSSSDEDARKNINVLFYNSNKDFAISLRSKGDDVIYLYRTDDNKTFDKLYSDMLDKAKAYKGDRDMSGQDKFKAPIIEFKEERSFDELCGKPIKDTKFMISKAIETVQFNMDEKGVKLKSEAAMMVEKAIIGFQPDIEPRYFYFDDRYVVFIEEQGKKPYFAMKVEDAKELQ